MPRGNPLAPLRIRVPADALRRLDRLARRERTDRSTVARRLLLAALTDEERAA